MINFTINGIPVQAEEGTTILAAARKAGVIIPALCFTPDLPAWGSCGLCIVRFAGSPRLIRACTTPVDAGLAGKDVITHDAEIIETRRVVMEMILSNHPDECLTCARSGCCELQTVAADLGIRDAPYKKIVNEIPIDDSSPAITLCAEKCIRCGRCVKVCQDVQNVWALEFLGRGFDGKIAAAADIPLGESPCIMCGQCAAHCPVGAIYERDDTAAVWKALRDKDAHPVAQIAPAIRVAIAEEFGAEPGELFTGKLYAALRRLGFKTVFDTNFGADLTIMEETAELVKRLADKSADVPMMTTCCPAWVDYLEKNHPDMIPNLSTAKSPTQMLGAMVKAYWAKKAGVAPEKVYSVSVMPCTAKKWESRRSEEMKSAGKFLGMDVSRERPYSQQTVYDIDTVITTRELARMIKQAGIDMLSLAEEEADSPLGPYSGAGTIFGATGGVMEAAVRTAHSILANKELPGLEFKPARGLDGVKEAEVDFGNGTKIRIAIIHQMGNAAAVLEKVRAAKSAGQEPPYHFMEVMACRGGCVGGGGQPYGATDETRAKRAAGLYRDDEKAAQRCSHLNPLIAELYKDFLGEPNGHKAHELLHTGYTARDLYAKQE